MKSEIKASWNFAFRFLSSLMKSFDVIIAGAGPAGLTAAIKLAGSGANIALLEKDIFPREKICGDALSGKVTSILKRMPDGIFTDFIERVEKVPALGIRFFSPGMNYVDLPYIMPKPELNAREASDIPGHAPGYLCRRYDFDNFLLGRCRRYSNISIHENTAIKKVVIKNGLVTAEAANETYTAKIILGADGVHSVVRRSLTGYKENKKHICLGIRAYYENVIPGEEPGFAELFFLRELLPCYFWIFAMPGNRFNVGLGMMQSTVTARKIKLSKVLDDILKNHPLISPRFKQAKMVGPLGAHSLPMHMRPETLSGDNFLMLGDAASLVDPFLGEGIGNAMASGEVAADIVSSGFGQNRFDAGFLNRYDQRIKNRILTDFGYSDIVRRFAGSAPLINFFVKRASRSKSLNKLLQSMNTDEEIRKKLASPLFYLGLLFR